MKDLRTYGLETLQCSAHDGLNFYRIGEYEAWARENEDAIEIYFDDCKYSEGLKGFAKRLFEKLTLSEALQIADKISFNQRWNDSFDLELNRYKGDGWDAHKTWIDANTQAPKFYDKIMGAIRDCADFAYRTEAQHLADRYEEMLNEILDAYATIRDTLRKIKKSLEYLDRYDWTKDISYNKLEAVYEKLGKGEYADEREAMLDLFADIDLSVVFALCWNREPKGYMRNFLDLKFELRDKTKDVSFNTRIVCHKQWGKKEHWLYKAITLTTEQEEALLLLSCEPRKLATTISRLLKIVLDSKKEIA